MSDLVKIIIRQTEILFKNLNAQIERCNLDAEIDGIQNARYLFHAIHSLDKWFINPETFCEPDKTVTGGIPAELSVIDSKRKGFTQANGTHISREQLLQYAISVEKKIQGYLLTLTDEKLVERAQDNGKFTRLELILGQFRHLMWHLGVSSAVTFMHYTVETGKTSSYSVNGKSVDRENEKILEAFNNLINSVTGVSFDYVSDENLSKGVTGDAAVKVVYRLKEGDDYKLEFIPKSDDESLLYIVENGIYTGTLIRKTVLENGMKLYYEELMELMK